MGSVQFPFVAGMNCLHVFAVGEILCTIVIGYNPMASAFGRPLGAALQPQVTCRCSSAACDCHWEVHGKSRKNELNEAPGAGLC